MGTLDKLREKAINLLSKKAINLNVNWTLSKSGTWVYPDEKSSTYIDKGYKELPNVYGLIEAILSKSTIVPF